MKWATGAIAGCGVLALALLARPAIASSSGATATSSAPQAAHADSTTARVVVVIGYNGHEGPATGLTPRAPLSFADDDAARLYLQLLPTAQRAWLLTTLDHESARLFPDLSEIARAPTREELAKVLGEAFWHIRQAQSAGHPTELVFAFAGHGDVDDGGMGYVVLADGPFSRDDLSRYVLGASPAELNHVIVDACASYFFVKSRGGARVPGEPLTPARLDLLTHGRYAGLSPEVRARTGLIVATSSAAEVHESAALSSGVFSYLLRSGLAGAADVSGDGAIEYGELSAFIASASQALDDPRARLEVHAEAPLQRPHATLQSWSERNDVPFLAIDERRPSRVRLLDPRGLPVAEAHSDGVHPVYLALVGQPFFLVQRDHDEAVLVPRSAGAHALSGLTFRPAPLARAPGSPGPFQGLFREPFGAAFAAGYWSSKGALRPLDRARFQPLWATAGAPPARLPVGLVGKVLSGAALTAGSAALVAVVGNQQAFQRLEAGFRATGQLDPGYTLEVEEWRLWASALTLGAGALGLVGGGLWLWSLGLEDGEVRLP